MADNGEETDAQEPYFDSADPDTQVVYANYGTAMTSDSDRATPIQSEANDENPLAGLAGKYADDPFWEEVQAEIGRSRKQEIALIALVSTNSGQ